MRRIYHINTYGVPAVCHSPVGRCPLGGTEVHFTSYEETEEFIEKLREEKEGLVNPVNLSSEKLVKNYFESDVALNEFHANKQVSTALDFDLMMISWASLSHVQEDMKKNMIGDAQYTYGEIIRILEKEIINERDYENGLYIRERYLLGKKDFPIQYSYYRAEEVWENQMELQKEQYDPPLPQFRQALGYSHMEVMYLPMEARKRLETDGFITDAEDLTIVLYRINPPDGINEIIAYSHSETKLLSSFDFYEFAGVVEGKTLYDFTHSRSADVEFDELWESGRWPHDNQYPYEYKIQREIYKSTKFMRGIEGPDIPRAFVRFSPIASSEIARFVRTHQTLMIAVSKMVGDKITEHYGYYQDEEEDEFGWSITDDY